jgi:hypothetical protein
MHLGWLGTTVFLFAAVFVPLAAPAGSDCQDRCYEAKSVEYQRCRAVPPADRKARVACFTRADEGLKRCLRKCK